MSSPRTEEQMDKAFGDAMAIFYCGAMELFYVDEAVYDGDDVVTPEEIKRLVVERQRERHPSSNRMDDVDTRLATVIAILDWMATEDDLQWIIKVEGGYSKNMAVVYK